MLNIINGRGNGKSHIALKILHEVNNENKPLVLIRNILSNEMLGIVDLRKMHIFEEKVLMIIEIENKYVVTVVDPETNYRYYGDRTSNKSWARIWANKNREIDGLNWEIIPAKEAVNYWIKNNIAYRCPHCDSIHHLSIKNDEQLLTSGKCVILCEKCDSSFVIIDDGDSIFVKN